MQYFNNNISWIIPTIVAVFFGLTTVLLMIKTLRKKKLKYYEVYKNKILDLSSSKLHKAIKIKYDNKEIEKLGYAICELKNIGNEAILKEDFLEGGNAWIDIKGSNIIGFQTKTNGKIIAEEFLNSIFIDPFDLNVGEIITFEIYTDGDIEEIKLGNPRIKGIRSIVKHNSKRNSFLLIIFSLFTLIFSLIVQYFNKKEMGELGKNFMENFANTKYMILMLLSYILLFITYFLLLKNTILKDKYNPLRKNKSSLYQKLRKIFKI